MAIAGSPGTSRIIASGVLLFLGAHGAFAASPESGPSPLSWTKLETQGASGLTFESACTYDSGADRVVMFGGHGHKWSGVERNDTWLFDPTARAWTAASPANRPPGACNTREVVFDESQGRSVYFGGCMYYHGWQLKTDRMRGGAPPWVYDAGEETWIPMKPIGDAPPRVAYAGMAYHHGHQVIVKFGGGGCNADDDGSTWIYDGYGNAWTRMSPDLAPTTGRMPAMVYDEDHDVILLIGSNDGMENDLWAYDLEADSWTKRGASSPPPSATKIDVNWGGPVDYGILIYDRASRRPLLFRPNGAAMGTWAYEWDRNAWALLATHNPPPGAGLAQAAYLPGRNVTYFVNGATPGFKDVIFGTWAFHHPPAGPSGRPEPPSNLQLLSRRGSSELSWTPSGSAGVVRYIVHRGIGLKPWEVTYRKIGEVAGTRFTDGKIPSEGIAFYHVTSVEAGGRESRPSLKVRTQPRAPREPRAWRAPGKGVVIEWDPSPETDVVGYHLYRGMGRPGYVDRIPHDGYAGDFNRLTRMPTKETRYLDSVEFPDHVAYLITAVNERGIESGPSPWTLGIPAEVKGIHVAAAEDQVIISWRPGREEGIRGYNVYRMDREEAETGIKLNRDPVAEPRFVDRTKRETGPCRYYVAAVDATGAEGLLSYGAWAFATGRE
jgi:hypothetical protein